jgi:hypothetical protein
MMPQDRERERESLSLCVSLISLPLGAGSDDASHPQHDKLPGPTSPLRSHALTPTSTLVLCAARLAPSRTRRPWAAQKRNSGGGKAGEAAAG